MVVRYLLVTAPDDVRIRLWLASGLYANWIEGRANRHGSETWSVTVLDRQAGVMDAFVAVAAKMGATVEEIEGAGNGERYHLLTGSPGSGWADPPADSDVKERLT